MPLRSQEHHHYMVVFAREDWGGMSFLIWRCFHVLPFDTETGVNEKAEDWRSATANGLPLLRHHQQARLRLRFRNMGAQAPAQTLPECGGGHTLCFVFCLTGWLWAFQASKAMTGIRTHETPDPLKKSECHQKSSISIHLQSININTGRLYPWYSVKKSGLLVGGPWTVCQAPGQRIGHPLHFGNSPSRGLCLRTCRCEYLSLSLS